MTRIGTLKGTKNWITTSTSLIMQEFIEVYDFMQFPQFTSMTFQLELPFRLQEKE